jgi:hypothetical protein
MEKLTFLVQGSGSVPYEVKLRKNGDNLTAICSCPAGSLGQYCKHRFQILEGEAKGIVSENQDQVSLVKQWLRGTDVEAALLDVRVAEKAAEIAKQNLSDAKRKLAVALGD